MEPIRQINAFTRDDGTPLNYTLVNIKDWCKNTFEVVRQLRINTDLFPAPTAQPHTSPGFHPGNGLQSPKEVAA